jgi:hypothetical protein
MDRFRSEQGQAGATLLGGMLVVGIVIAFICGVGFLMSIKGTDSGQVCVVREGGFFDGRGIAEVRQPGQGPKPIGIWNHQDCLPSSERDSNDVLASDPKFPTRDAVQVIADGQVLFSLTTDPALVTKFYLDYGRRKWGGESITSDKGWLNFLQQRFAPPILDAYRQTLGKNDCTPLNNLCQYILDPAKATATPDKNGKVAPVEKGDTSQNLSKAQADIVAQIKTNLKAAFKGNEYFENIRYQNLRIRFEPEVERQITEAQSLRTQVANASLEAERRTKEAEGATAVSKEQAKQIREKANAYKDNPAQADIDKLRALCGPDGCGNLQVLGSSATKLLR